VNAAGEADDLHVPDVMEIWEPKPPGTLWATPGLLRDQLTFFLPFSNILKHVMLKFMYLYALTLDFAVDLR